MGYKVMIKGDSGTCMNIGDRHERVYHTFCSVYGDTEIDALDSLGKIQIDGRWATAAWIEIDGFIESGDVALLFQQYQNPPLGLSL